MADRVERLFEGASGLKTLTSKKALSKELPQNPWATMSRRAPSFLLVEAPSRDSLVMGCKVGSVETPWQVSLSREAVTSLSSLCRSEG